MNGYLSYSRFVSTVKIVFPLIALGLLSSLVLFSRNVDPEDALPFVGADVDALASSERLNRPHYVGVSRSGAAVSVSAATVTSEAGAEDLTEFTRIIANIVPKNGVGAYRISSDDGVADTARQIMFMSGNVRVETSDDIVLETEKLSASLEYTDVASDVGVVATGPFGRLTAKKMRLTGGDSPGEGYLLVFKDKVKLVYDPQKED